MLKRFLKILNILFILFGFFSFYLYISDSELFDQITAYYTEEHSLIVSNNYGINIERNYFQKSNNFSPKSKKDLLNIYYTVLSSGTISFTFHCDKTYDTCIDDVKDLMSDNSLLSHINNFIHPFNTYKYIKTTYTTAGKITITVTKLYSDEEIEMINKKVVELLPTLVSSDKSTTENIKSIHDYIVNNVQYDSAYAEGTSLYKANTAYGALFEGYAVCSGYTDLISIFLNKIGVSNYKVSNDRHVWNLVYLDGQWLHLDLTFDDPIYEDNQNRITHNYFLITTEKLKELDQESDDKNAHVFNEKIYGK
ncbi:MAG: hypothetical protein GX247_00100 [Mollicutes bacterium]|jgi:hypothetical protein|nr:hypothetical protein [Mollicutes bacterium]